MSMSPISIADSAATEKNENSFLKQQLVREITCLERQLERVRLRQDFADETTLQTYEEMIESRRKMLHNLPWDE